jgi:hypothetical protein
VTLTKIGVQADAVVSAVARTEVRRDPFPHLVMSGIFPSDVLDRLVGMLPDDEEYLRFRAPDSLDPRNPYRSSWRLKLDDRAPDGPSERFRAWVGVADELKAPRLRDAFLDVFGLGRPVVKVGVRLYRDEGGSFIGPHTDGPDKLVTCILYLPTDGELVGCGTRLLAPRDPDFVPPPDEEYEHTRFYQRDDLFTEVAEAPCRLNTAMAMARSPRSFHAVRVPAGVPTRYSLMYRLIRR